MVSITAEYIVTFLVIALFIGFVVWKVKSKKTPKPSGGDGNVPDVIDTGGGGRPVRPDTIDEK